MRFLKQHQFWICVGFSVLFFALLCPISVSRYTGAYYVLAFNAISIMGFGMTLYRILTKSFTRGNILRLIWFLIVSSLPHCILVLLSYGSWVCLGLSITIVIALVLILLRKRVRE